MNPYGSYRRLLEHSKQAMIAAVELYNKPNFTHREPILSMLLVNAWELAFLAVLSKNRMRIFAPKKRNEPLRTLNFDESLESAKKHLPHSMDKTALLANIKLLRRYRNEATHYYKDAQSQHAIYAIAQASIKNFRDFVVEIFEQDISNEVNLVLLPLTFNQPPDFVEYFRNVSKASYSPFVKELFAVLQELGNIGNSEHSRLITRCYIKLESAKDITHADIVASKGGEGDTHLVLKPVNPDDSHPFFQKDIIGDGKSQQHKRLKRSLSSYQFQVLLWKYKIKQDSAFCWQSKKGGSPRYSQKIFEFLNGISNEELKVAGKEYRERK